MESAGSERDTAAPQAGARPGGAIATVPSIDQETELLRRAREAFRFGPDGRLLPIAPPDGDGGAERRGPAAAPSVDRSSRATLEALRSWVSHDPVLDECFEEALDLDPVDVADATDATPAPAAASDLAGDRARSTSSTAAVRPNLPGGSPVVPVSMNGRSSNGHGTNGHATNGHATNGDVEEDAGAGAATNGLSVTDHEPAPDPGVPIDRTMADELLRAALIADALGADPGDEDVDDGERARGIDLAAETVTDDVAAGTGDRTRDDAVASLVDPVPRPFPVPERSRGSRPMLEWPDPPDPERRVDPLRAVPPTIDADVQALATALGSSPEVEVAFARTLAVADAPMGMFRWPSGAAQWANDALESWLLPGGRAERTFVALLDEWSQAHFLARILPELLRRGRWRGQLTFAAADGRTESMLVTLVAHDDDHGGTDAVSVLAMPLGSIEPPAAAPPAPADVVVPAAAFPPSRSGPSDQLFNALVQHVSDLIVVTDVHGRVTFSSPAARALLDLAPATDGVRPNLLAILHPDNRPTNLAALARQPDEGALPPHPLRVLGADGSWRDLSGVLTDLTAAPAVGGYVLNARDVTDAVRAEQSITDRAFTDELTGLANRVRLLDRLEGLAHAEPPGACALVVLGLDHLRRVESEHGSIAAEIILAEVGARLAEAVTARADDALAARLHGDEFALLVPGVHDIGDAVGIAGQLRMALREPVRVGDELVVVTASFGVTTSADARADDAFDEILARADLAMREAKDHGRDRTLAYDARMAHRQEHRRGIDQQLRRAIDSDGLRIQFQPIVELASGRIVGAEALLRVRGDDGELLSPGAFVEAAESNGLISRLGAAVLRTTCEQAVALDLDRGGFPISVNVSPRQIADGGFARRVLGILDDTGLAPRQLSLEITEGAFVGRDDASETNIVVLRDEGVRIGLDEFGGDTSLGYLRRFPLDFVKIDRRLIAGLGNNYVDGTIVRATIELAHKLGLLTVAVGVEHDEQQHRLEQLGCDRAQGYLFGSAVAATELANLVHGRR